MASLWQQALRRSRRRRRPTRPAPVTQPGPFRATERTKVRRYKRTPQYWRALEAARRHREPGGAAGIRGVHGVPGSPYPPTAVQRRQIRLRGTPRQKRALRQLTRAETSPATIRALHHQYLDRLGLTGEANAYEPSVYEKAWERYTPLGRLGVSAPDPVAELEGRGWSADIAKGLRGLIPDELPVVGTGAGSLPIAASTGKGSTYGGPSKLPANLLKDAIDLPAQAVPSAYMTGRAIVKAAQGDPEEAERLWEEFKKTSAWAALARGDLKEFQRRAGEHPLITGLEAWGGKAIVGRGAGAAARSGVAGRRAREAASTRRAPLELFPEQLRDRTGTPGPRIERDYSRDLIDKGIQVALERRARRRGRDQNMASRRQQISYLNRRVDQDVALTEALRRRGRDEAVAMTRAALPSRQRMQARLGRTMNDQAAKAVPLVVSRIVRSPETLVQDLRHYRNVVASTDVRSLSHAELRAHDRTLREIDALLDDPEFLRNPQAAFDAAERFAAAQDARDIRSTQLGLVEPSELDAKNIPYAVVHLDARYVNDVDGTGRPGFVVEDEAGGLRELTAADVRQHMSESGVQGAAHFTMRPRARGAGSFYIRAIQGRGTRPANLGRRRTGEAARRGVFDLDPEVLVEQAARSRGLIDAAEGFDRMLRGYAIRRPIVRRDGTVDPAKGGWFRSFDEAYRFADELTHDPETGALLPGAMELVPVSLGRVSKAKLDTIRENLGDVAVPGDRAMDNLSERLMEAFVSEGEGGKIALVPKLVRDRLEAHNLRLSAPEKALQKINQTFKNVVLPTSTNWVFGNLTDITMRSMAYGLNPVAYKRGRRLLRVLEDIDPELARQFEARTVQGAHMASVENLRVHREASQFVDTSLEGAARWLSTVRHAPGPAQVVALWEHLRNFIFGLNKTIEVHPQYAALGKLARRDVRHLLSKQQAALRVSDDALRDLAQGLRGTDAQVRYARFTQEIFGNWTANGPNARRFLINWFPFGAWLRAATRFVWVTMPKDHPIKTGLLAASYEMTEKERNLLGLSIFADEDRKPPFLQGSVPLGGDRTIPFAGFSSFGMWSQFPSAQADMVLPQFTGALATAAGLDWKGDKLRHADGTEPNQGELALYAIYVQAEAFMPFLAQARRVQEAGGQTVFGSTVFDPKIKPGSEKGQEWERLLNPVMPVERNPSTGGDSTELDLDDIELDANDIELDDIDPGDIDVEALREQLELSP